MLRRAFIVLHPGPRGRPRRPARASAGRDPDRLRRRLDEERGRRHQCRLHQGDRHQGGGELRGILGAGEADRARRAGRRVRLGRSRMDGLCRAKKAHQGRHPRQPARQQAGADRAEGLQARQRDDRPGLRSSPSSPATAASRSADVRAVPAGKYAKAALEKLGGWAAAEPKLASAENVRAALALVGRGEAPLGIVYETDAKIEKNVKIVGHFPEGSHPPITYPVALTATAKPERRSTSPSCARIRRRRSSRPYGFTFLIKPTS